MHKIDEVAIETDLLKSNRALAGKNRKLMDENGIAAFDISGSIGSGKTSLIEEAIKGFGIKAGVVAGDVMAEFDARRLERLGVETVAMNTGRECHLDAHLIGHALEKLPLASLDVLFFENVGNLICPTDFALGAHRRVVVVSVTEGEDIVAKHPMIFRKSHMAVINKVDIAEHVGVSPEKLARDARKINPGMGALLTSVKDGTNINEWRRLIEGEVERVKRPR